MIFSILIVEDEEATRYVYSKHLTRSGFKVHEAANLKQARQEIANHGFDAILLDLGLPDGSGLEWLIEARDTVPNAAIIIITGAREIPLAVEAMRRGAENFLTKPVDLPDLEAFLRKTLDTATIKRSHRAHSRRFEQEEPYFGKSAAMQDVLHLCSLAAKSDAPVLLFGESGTGKGVLARWIHQNGVREKMPFVEVNCSALRGELLASELFGHAKGAFTSAVDQKQGLLDVADGGTLFLDEIGDTSLEVQAQLLKAVEEKKYRRLGDVRERRSEFRAICATHHDLESESREGKFRQDLYFRIRVLPIHIPPLRERLEELPELIDHLFCALTGSKQIEIADDSIALLQSYDWPGNLRELRNILERALLLAQGETVTPKHFPGIQEFSRIPLASFQKDPHSEDSDLASVIRRFKGNKKQAAKHLGISRATLYRKLKNRH